MLLSCDVGEDSWESLGLQGDPTSPFSRKSVLNIHWKDRCWSWSSNTLATWCEELTHWKRPWCWKGLGAGEGDNRGWDGWMASPTQRTWVWVNSRSWWWTGKPGVLQSMGLQSQTRLSDWTELTLYKGEIRSLLIEREKSFIRTSFFWGHYLTWYYWWAALGNFSCADQTPVQPFANMPVLICLFYC